MFTALLHPDYHTPKDEPDRINTEKVTCVARWIYLTGWEIANQPQRVRLDKSFKPEDDLCIVVATNGRAYFLK
jgi:hypothetical protein